VTLTEGCWYEKTEFTTSELDRNDEGSSENEATVWILYVTLLGVLAISGNFTHSLAMPLMQKQTMIDSSILQKQGSQPTLSTK